MNAINECNRCGVREFSLNFVYDITYEYTYNNKCKHGGRRTHPKI